MARAHQPGEAVFRAVLPEDIAWKPFPAFPPAVRLAVLVGQAAPDPVRARQRAAPDRDPVHDVLAGR